MSARLQTQFDCLYQEELARWDAQIKALQVHINPHFLNNTLESINWQARMSGDVKASGMIEARSTVLDAAPDRKGMPQDQGWLIGTYMYDQTFNRGNVDYGSAIAMLIVVLGVWSLTTLYPFVWVILNSFREKGLIRKDSFSIPLPGGGFTMDNYSKAMDRFDFANAYFNSLIVSVSATVMVILAGLAAYGLVRCRFRLRGVCYSLIMAGMMFPVFSTIILVFRMEAAWGIASSGNRWLSLLAVILPQIAGNLCFATIVLMGFIESVPIELEESAYVGGCHVFQAYFHIIMPAAKSSFATVAIFSFLWSYNDLFTQNFFLRVPREKTITLLLNRHQGQTFYDLLNTERVRRAKELLRIRPCASARSPSRWDMPTPAIFPGCSRSWKGCPPGSGATPTAGGRG